MLGFESDSYFICTETSPRCFVLQQVNSVDNSTKDGKISNAASSSLKEQNNQPKSQQKQAHQLTSNNQATLKQYNGNINLQEQQAQPQAMMLPWWFTTECRQQLLSIPSFEAFAQHSSGTSYATISRSATPEQMSIEQLRSRLKHQLEYYFSRENLINDRYLRCQMDADQYVPIKIVAGFPKVAQLTNDFDLIVDVLRSSTNVQVDENGKKVRPVTKRCTIILREIPENATENDVKAMFDGCPKKYVSIAYGLNNSWYVTFKDEEATKLAFVHLKDLAFDNKPIHARIKTGNAPGNPNSSNLAEYGNFVPTCVTPVPPAEKGDVVSMTNLGQIIVHDITHHYHNHSLQNHVQQQQRHYLPIEVDTTTASMLHNTTMMHSLSPSSNNNGNFLKSAARNNKNNAEKFAESITTNLPSSLNLGLLLAQYGYVPRATFRPNTTSSIPDLVVSGPTPVQLSPAQSFMTNATKDNENCSINETLESDKENSKVDKDASNMKELLHDNNNVRLKTDASEKKEHELNQASTEKNNKSGNQFEKKIPPAPPPPPPDFGRQRITDVPRLNKNRCSPLLNGKSTTNFLVGLNLVTNGLYSRLNSKNSANNAGPIAFTDGTNLNALIDPNTLLNGPQIMTDIITASVDKRRQIDNGGSSKTINTIYGKQMDDDFPTTKHINDLIDNNNNLKLKISKKDEKAKNVNEMFEDPKYREKNLNVYGQNNTQLFRENYHSQYCGGITRTNRNRFSEEDNIAAPLSRINQNYFNNNNHHNNVQSSGQNFTGNKRLNICNNVNNNTNIIYNDVKSSISYEMPIRTRRSTYNNSLNLHSTSDSTTSTSLDEHKVPTIFENTNSEITRANPLFNSNSLSSTNTSIRNNAYYSKTQPIGKNTSSTNVLQRRMEYRTNHFSIFYNSSFSNEIRSQQNGLHFKRHSLSSKENTVINNTDSNKSYTNTKSINNHGINKKFSFDSSTNRSTSFEESKNINKSSTEFSLMDAEFPQLTNDKKRATSLQSTHLGEGEQPYKKPVIKTRNNNDNAPLHENAQSSSTIKFSTVVAGAIPNNNHNKQQMLVTTFANQNLMATTPAFSGIIDKCELSTISLNNKNNVTDVGAMKCSYAQTLKKTGR